VTTPPNQAKTCLCHPHETRALRLAEFAAVQGFPTDWEFSGSRAEMYRQVGNAVPIRLGQVPGDTAAELLDKIYDNGRGEDEHPRCIIENMRSSIRFSRTRASAGR
jgi:DNA (cytosine-5)-methyltransferase 1